MRATKAQASVYDVTLNSRQQRFFEAQALRLGISVPEAIALSAELAVRAGLPLPVKEGRVLPFEALKSEQKGPKTT